MTIVFVHGNPESDAIWGPLRSELGRDDTVCLSPPGFGAPLPDGFGATVLEYRDWLVAELEAIGEPVDLVGHDWGGGHVVNVAMHRPDLLRSWVSDVVGLFDPGYVWHDLAQVWQTPVEGEKNLEAAAARPGLHIVATEDGYVGTDDMRGRAGKRAGARTARLEGLGHWWMLQDPARGAAALEEFLG